MKDKDTATAYHVTSNGASTPKHGEGQGVPWWTSCRVVMAVVGLFSFFCAYSQRVGMSVAIVCMVNQTAVRHLMSMERASEQHQLPTPSPSPATPFLIDNYTTVLPDTAGIDQPPAECVRHYGNSTEGSSDGPFVWDKELQGHILGSFFYGYVVSQVPAGLLAERFGGRWVFFCFMLLSTIGTILTPLGASVSPALLIVLRILCGIGSGGLFPAMHVLISRWTPPEERSKISGLTYSGAWMGNIISFPVSGILCRYGFGGGWSSIFYIIGMVSAVALVLWVIFVYSTPMDHPRVSEAERDYITLSLKDLLKDESKEHKMSTPWLHIITSPAVWALILANVTTDWGLYTFLTNIPTYMYEVLYFDIAKNGLLSALPFIGLWSIVLTSPIVADKLIASNKMSVKWTRKLMNSIGAFGGGALVLCLAYFSCTQAHLAVATLTCGVAITGFVYSGFMVNYMDIAPRFAGTLFGIGNCTAALTGFIAPYTVAVLTKNQTQEEWRRVFYISSAIYMFGGLFFLIFSQGTVQKWARDTREDHVPEGEQMKPLQTKEQMA